MGKTLASKLSETGKAVKVDSTGKDIIPYIDFMSKKIKVRIHYPSGEVKEYKAKVAMHHIDIEDKSYVIHPDAFYREGKTYYIDYYYGNPRPIIFKYENESVLVASSELKKQLMNGEYKGKRSKNGKETTLSVQDFEALPYEDKIQFPGVMEVDSVMLNKIITQKAAADLWGKDEMVGAKKWVLIGIMVLVAAAVIGWKIYKGTGGAT